MERAEPWAGLGGADTRVGSASGRVRPESRARRDPPPHILARPALTPATVTGGCAPRSSVPWGTVFSGHLKALLPQLREGSGRGCCRALSPISLGVHEPWDPSSGSQEVPPPPSLLRPSLAWGQKLVEKKRSPWRHWGRGGGASGLGSGWPSGLDRHPVRPAFTRGHPHAHPRGGDRALPPYLGCPRVLPHGPPRLLRRRPLQPAPCLPRMWGWNRKCTSGAKPQGAVVKSSFPPRSGPLALPSRLPASPPHPPHSRPRQQAGSQHPVFWGSLGFSFFGPLSGPLISVFMEAGGSSFLILSFNIFLRLSVSPRWGLLFHGCVTVFANEGRRKE